MQITIPTEIENATKSFNKELGSLKNVTRAIEDLWLTLMDPHSSKLTKAKTIRSFKNMTSCPPFIEDLYCSPNTKELNDAIAGVLYWIERNKEQQQ